MNIKIKKILSFLLSIVIILSVPLSSSAYLIGDANRDGKINPKDARLVLRHIAKLELLIDTQYADIDGNGKITANDARKILRISAKLETYSYSEASFTYSSVPEFSNEPYVYVNNNTPYFSFSDYTVTSYEFYSDFDSLGRCDYAMACLGKETMPKDGEKRESISSVIPTGWVNNSYDFVDGGRIYNRCHLIGWQLSAENSNKQNLITGTRYMNVEGMLPFENKTDDYIEKTNNHVLYRVTPIFIDNELVCRGVLMEAYSVEDNGNGIKFCIFCYNVQPGIDIDYKTGNNSKSSIPLPPKEPTEEIVIFIVNTSSGKFHIPTCSSVDKIKPENKATSQKTKQELINDGYSPCKTCLK